MIRYYWWMLNCTRREWVQRIFDAYEAGYKDMPTYYRQVIRGKR